jgi:methyl-accepting chemotaxis protein
MAGWVGPVVAISVLLIAICVVGITIAVALVFREAQQASKGLTAELSELRRELSPTLAALNKFGDAGSEVVDLARQEVRELVSTSQEMRTDVRRGMRRARRRLADLDALVEVMQEEVEETAIDAATAMRTIRTGRGVIGHVRRFLAPRPSDDDIEEDDDE